MAEYRWHLTGELVVRVSDNAFIPNHPGNTDWQAFEKWVAAGGVPDPAPPPVSPPPA